MIAVAVGYGSVWALDAGSTLYRLNPRTARVAKRIPLDATAAYNIWIGAGAVWVADDQGARVLRISPRTNKTVAHISVGDGPADMVFVGKKAWVITHRDNTLYRVDTATNVATRLAIVGGSDAAAERLAMAGDSSLDHRARCAAPRGGSRDRSDPPHRGHRRHRNRCRRDGRCALGARAHRRRRSDRLSDDDGRPARDDRRSCDYGRDRTWARRRSRPRGRTGRRLARRQHGRLPLPIPEVKRREFTAVALGAGVGIPLAAVELSRALASPETLAKPRLPDRPLPIPQDAVIRTAVAIGPGTNVIDLAGPWEVFQDAAISAAAARFELFTVAQETKTVEASGGLRIEPTYSYETAPQPQVVVVPAHQSSGRTLEWLREVAQRADLVMSVCTGAYIVAETGLLDGMSATTHHGSYDDFEASFPAIRVVRGRRFVEHQRVATAGGLTAGIDLALRVVERYLGRDARDVTAAYLEYERPPVPVA